MAALVFLLAIGIASALGWFVWPAVMDTVTLKRQNARIRALTMQTKRDMDSLARRQHRDGW